MKTVCVGRFLIDLPADADISIDRSFVSGFDLATFIHESEAEFWTRLETIDAEIAAARKQDGQPMLESVEAFAFGEAKGRLWVYNQQRTRIPKEKETIEVEDVSLRSVVRFPSMSLSATAEGLPFNSGRRLGNFLKQIRPLSGGEIPAEPGFCIENAFVRDPYEHRNTEAVVLAATLPGHPDVSILFSSMSGTAQAPGLFERNAKAEQKEPFYTRLALSTLRAGRRTINGLAGEELVLRVREPNLTTGYAFQWETRGKPKDIHAPVLTLELEAGTNPVSGGQPVQSTLAEEALFDLWEGVARSIQVRPAQDVLASLQKPVSIPLQQS